MNTDIEVGVHVFYPQHGVAKVAAKETHNFGDCETDFFVLELRRGGRSLVPTTNVEQAGIRSLISANKAKSLLKSMKTKPALEDKSWKERGQIYTELLKSGECECYTQVLQDLMYRAQENRLSTSEQRTLEQARSYFIGEVGTVLAKEPDQLERDLSKAVEAGVS